MHTLDIDSDFSPGHMLNDFEFPALEKFTMTTRRSQLFFFQEIEFITIRWENLTNSTINGDFNESES
ncbi:hypothetical protein H0H87_010820, partial [Tephrocybe sp. NHM501043]